MEPYTLREVNVNAMIVDEDALHFKVCLLAVLLVFEFDKGVLKTVTGPLVADNLAGQNLAKSAEDQFKILIYIEHTTQQTGDPMQ